MGLPTGGSRVACPAGVPTCRDFPSRGSGHPEPVPHVGGVDWSAGVRFKWFAPNGGSIVIGKGGRTDRSSLRRSKKCAFAWEADVEEA